MIVHVDKFGGRNIADCGEFAGDRVNIDNARLIAAAPDMLAALKDANRMLDIAKRYFPKSIRDNNRFALLNVQANSVMKAIVKAEGK